MDLRLDKLRKRYLSGDITPRQVLDFVISRISETKANPAWIYVLGNEEIKQYLDALNNKKIEDLPLYGIPFAIKDNIDLAGVPTTAACPEFSYTPEKSATVVQRLIDAGAIPVGKANMDQFATGLVGVRSPDPWGPCCNVFDKNMISGGSSSGSAVAVALGQVSFSLGTDTAGSGRVPASLNNIVGLKPSRGIISTEGVVPACKSLDCVSIFALNIENANTVLDVAVAFDKDNAYSRANPHYNNHRYYKPEHNFTLGVPKRDQLAWFGMEESQGLFFEAIKNIEAAGGGLQEIDFSPFIDAAKLLYEGPWVAERYHAIKEIFDNNPGALLPVIHTIIGKGAEASALDTFDAQYKLAALRRRAEFELNKVDAIVTPTMPRYFSIDEVAKEPVVLNSQLGYYTNFMNLLDCSAVAVPCGFYKNGVGFGVTLFQSAFSDKKLLSIAATIQNKLQLAPGNCGLTYDLPVEGSRPSTTRASEASVDVLVCGAHLDGLPLNWQLRERGASLQLLTQTSRHYRFYALPGGPPLRPALVRVNESENDGVAIEVEIWRMPKENFGSFVAEIPAPLGIGQVEIEDGRWLSGFICDQWGLAGATDISHFGSWRNFLSAKLK